MHTETEALAEAAHLAGHAPSIHNSQPWRWLIRDAALDLYAEHARRLGITDPDCRLATLSCGAALHHARTALAAQGWRADVVRLAALEDGPRHGYAVKDALRDGSGGRFDLPTGTVRR